MPNDKKHIPDLCFPEFKNNVEWSTDTLETIFAIKNGYTPSKSNPSFWDNGTIPWFRMEDIRKNGHILSDSIQHITPKAVKGSGLFPAYSIIVATTATIGEHALVIVDSLANQRFTFLTKRKSFDKKIDMLYFHYFMFVVDEWCKRNTNIGGLLSVNMDRFKKLLISYPQTLTEQTKIAECFISLDRLLDSTKRKLELLKEHKKGMMQRLFPTENKTVPEYRFPQFKNDQEWEEKRIIDLFDKITRGYVLPTSELKQQPTKEYQYPVYSSQTTNDGLLGYYNKALYKDAITWTTDGANAGTVSLRIGEFYCTNVCGVLISEKGYANKCIAEIINYYCKKYVSYVGNPKLMNNTMSEICICVPPSLIEQLKLSDCLLFIDKIISRTQDKIRTLEQHKKGLIQQIFPKL